MNVKVFLLKGKPNPSEIETTSTIQKWMLENLYDLGWEAEFKNLVTPDMIASMFRLEPTPFGIPFKKKDLARNLSVGDVIQIGPLQYLILQSGFRELEIPKVGGSQ